MVDKLAPVWMVISYWLCAIACYNHNNNYRCVIKCIVSPIFLKHHQNVSNNWKDEPIGSVPAFINCTGKHTNTHTHICAYGLQKLVQKFIYTHTSSSTAVLRIFIWQSSTHVIQYSNNHITFVKPHCEWPKTMLFDKSLYEFNRNGWIGWL